MVTAPTNCPDPDCDNSLGGMYDGLQYEELEPNVWECRECGRVLDHR